MTPRAATPRRCRGVRPPRRSLDGGGLAVAVGVLRRHRRPRCRACGASRSTPTAATSPATAPLALTWYIATSEAAIVSVNTRLIEDIGNDIAPGTVAVELLRPASVLGVRVATEVGRGLPARGAVGRRRRASPRSSPAAPPRPAALAPGRAEPRARRHRQPRRPARLRRRRVLAPRRRARSWFLYQKVVFILGGMLIPLEVLPDWLAARRRCCCRSRPWPTPRPGSRPATSSRCCSSSRSAGSASLAVGGDRRVPRRRAPPAGGRRMSGLRRHGAQRLRRGGGQPARPRRPDD